MGRQERLALMLFSVAVVMSYPWELAAPMVGGGSAFPLPELCLSTEPIIPVVPAVPASLAEQLVGAARDLFVCRLRLGDCVRQG